MSSKLKISSHCKRLTRRHRKTWWSSSFETDFCKRQIRLDHLLRRVSKGHKSRVIITTIAMQSPTSLK